jgi:hypothetical protein
VSRNRARRGGRWRIPKRAVHALLDERPTHRRRVVRRRAGYAAGPGEAAGPSERELELEGELKTLNREMGRLEGRPELTELAESTLRAERERLLEDLEREKRRAESERAGELEERLELSSRAESSLLVERGRLSGDLAQERERADQLEEQLLRAQHDAERLAADLHAHQQRRRGFWSRLFGRR